jgi:hypothetical protein
LPKYNKNKLLFRSFFVAKMLILVDPKPTKCYTSFTVTKQEHKMAILAKDVGRKILETLRESARQALPDATEAEREESIAKFLGVISDAMFAGPAKKLHKNNG